MLGEATIGGDGGQIVAAGDHSPRWSSESRKECSCSYEPSPGQVPFLIGQGLVVSVAGIAFVSVAWTLVGVRCLFGAVVVGEQAVR